MNLDSQMTYNVFFIFAAKFTVLTQKLFLAVEEEKDD